MYFFTDIPDKLDNLNTFVVENDFFTEKQKKVYMDLFSKAQKHYFSFFRQPFFEIIPMFFVCK